jgi:MoxR-like ATPase
MAEIKLQELYRTMRSEAEKVIVGLEEPFEQLVIALFSGGHVLLEGVPGTAKTLMAKTLAHLVQAQFSRVQFTPDLMPSDILGTNVFNMTSSTFYLRKGPIFTQILLADEINRAPAKTQSALLEAMEERQVNLDGERHPLDSPFMVVATQNPIEYEGTYPLPEAQLDRFMFNIKVGYPSRAEEMEIMKRTTSTQYVELQALLDGEQIQRLQEVVRQVVVADHVFEYVADLVRATRPREANVPKFVPELLSWGAGPRACQYMILGGKARAILHGRLHVTTEDIRAVAYPVLRHRLVTTFNADAEGITTDQIIQRLIEAVPLPQEEAAAKVRRA